MSVLTSSISETRTKPFLFAGLPDTGDDATNIHGNYATVDRIAGPRCIELRFMHSQHAGFPLLAGMEKMGYKPQPALSALMRQYRLHPSKRDVMKMAFINSWNEPLSKASAEPLRNFYLARKNHKPSAATCGRQAGTAFVDWMKSNPATEVRARVAKGEYGLPGLANYDQKDYWTDEVSRSICRVASNQAQAPLSETLSVTGYWDAMNNAALIPRTRFGIQRLSGSTRHPPPWIFGRRIQAGSWQGRGA